MKMKKVYGLAGITAPGVIIFCDWLAVLLTPGYDPFTQSMSSLALKPAGLIQAVGLYVAGLLVVIFTVGFFNYFYHTWNVRAAFGIYIYIGIGLIISATFRTTPVNQSWDTEAIIHAFDSSAMFLLFPIGCFLLCPSMLLHHDWQKFWIYTLLTGIIGVCLLLIWIRVPSAWVYFGFSERLIVYNAVSWIEIMGIHTFRLENKH